MNKSKPVDGISFIRPIQAHLLNALHENKRYNVFRWQMKTVHGLLARCALSNELFPIQMCRWQKPDYFNPFNEQFKIHSD